MGFLSIPFFILPSHYLRKPARIWIKGIFIILKYTCNITHEVIGKQNIPDQSVLIISKHQSAFETFALFYYFKKAIFIHKKQLFLIPIFGQYLKKINMISIDRKGGAKTMRDMLKKTKEKVDKGFSIIIFPEGTRKKPGEKPDYKSGFVGIYNQINTQILPVAVNSGNFWPKNTFIKKPGKIIISILKVLPNDLERKDILKIIESKIEKESNRIRKI
tara:strand:- start:1721 stop:2371 length:651 start_codon:yes stop_codon:yes gene_type:complete